MRSVLAILVVFFGVSGQIFGQGFPNVPQTAGSLLTPLLEPNQGRTAVIAYHNGWLYTAPEAPSSQPGSDILARRWDISNLASVQVEEVLGISPMPILAHGYLKMGNNLVLGSNWPPEAPWSFEATAPGVNLRTVTPGLEGVWNRGHLYQPWGATTFWSYSDVNFPMELTLGGVVQSTWDHVGETGVIGFPFIVGNILIMAADQTRTGVATYDISDPTNPVLLDILTTGGPGGYWPSLWGGDGHLYVVFPYRTGGNGIRVVDVTDPADMQFVADIPLPGDECMYAQFQDHYAFAGSHKVNMSTLTSELSFPSDANGIDTSQFLLPLGNLLVTGGSGSQQGMAIWAHQDAPDTQGPTVGYHIPRAGQTNYPVGSPISVLIHETLESPTIESGTSFIVRPVGGSQVAGQWVLAFDDTLTFTPDSPLQADTTYEVIFPEGRIEDAAGNGMEAYAFTFSTGSEVSGNEAPEVTSWTVSSYPAATSELLTFDAVATDPEMDALEYRFDFGDGTPKTDWGSDVQVQHAYTAQGHYPAKVQVRDSSGLIVTRSTTVTVTDFTPGAAGPVNSSPIVCDEANRRIWAVNPDNNTISMLDADSLTVVFEVGVGQDPRSVAIDDSGNAWVACYDDDQIDIVSPAGSVVDTIDLDYGDGPIGIVISQDGTYAWVSMMNAGVVRRFSTATRVNAGNVNAGPTPRALALSANGGTLYVSRFLSPVSHGEVRQIDTGSLTVTNTIILYKFGWDAHRDGTAEGMGVANYLTGLALSPDGEELLVACNKMNTDRGALSGADLDSDNTVRNIVCVVDTATAQVVDALDIDNSDSSHAVAFSPLGDYFFTALQGNNEIAVFDRFAAGSGAGLGGLINRRSVGDAPQGICIDPTTNRIFVKNFLGRSVSVIEGGNLFQTGQASLSESQIDTVASELLSASVLNGKRIFYHASDPRMSAEGYMSCATCHLDGGHDGRIWDFTGRGEGLRNTISLRGRSGVGHGNVHWSSNFDEIQDFEHDIRNAFGGTGFLTDEEFALVNDPLGASKAGVDSDLDDLAAYVSSLANESIPKSPHRSANGEPTPSAAAGATVFTDLSCNTCHVGDSMQDGVMHDVGTLHTTSGDRLGGALTGIDTPTLRGLWNGAPFLHDGSAEALDEVFTVAGGTSYPAEDGAVSGGAYLYDGQGVFLNYDAIPYGGAIINLVENGEVEFSNVNGGTGGMGTIEIRYSAGWFTTANLRVNGVDHPVQFQPGVNNPTWRATDFGVVRIENVSLNAGPTNVVEIIGTNAGNTAIDEIVVSTVDDLAQAQVHHQVDGLPAQERADLMAFLLELDGSEIPGAGPPLEPEEDDIAPLGDEFDDSTTITNWNRLNDSEGWNSDKLETFDVDTTTPGNMRIMPYTTSWYMDLVGPLVYKEISGDFVVTMQLDASRRGGLAGRPQALFSLGGIMIRTPRNIVAANPNPDPAPDVELPWPPAGYTTDWTPDGENYIFLSYGNAGGTTPANQWTYEVKTTINGNSQLYYDSQGVPADESVVTLQAIRRGSTFVVMRKHGAGDWIVENRFNRPDMPDTLQVGITTYTDWASLSAEDMFTNADNHAGQFRHNHNVMTAENGFSPNPDLVVDVEYYRFARPPASVTEMALQSLPLTSEGMGIQTLSGTSMDGVLGDTINQPYEPVDPGDPPGIPQNISAVYGGNLGAGISVTWDAVVGADTYEVWRGTSADSGSMTQVATVAIPEYTDTNINFGDTLFYRVRAVNTDGTSDYSIDGSDSVPAPDPRPDLTIGKGLGGQRGNDVYNATGAGQRLVARYSKRAKGRLVGFAQNDSLAPDTILLSGSRAKRPFRVKYFLYQPFRTNVTAGVISGGTPSGVLAPGESRRFDMRITSSSKRGRAKFLITGSSGESLDRVKVITKVAGKKKRR